MAMKREIYHLIGMSLLPIILFSACTSEVDDYFDQSASERIEQAVNRFQEILVTPEHGWVLEYYPGGSNQTFGGYAVTMKFKTDGTVACGSVLASDLETMTTSLYSLKKDMGATLNFDTYNTNFHYFSTPDIPSLGDGSGKGLMGDYEFLIESGAGDQLRLVGKKHRSVIHMYPLTEPSADYLKKVRALYDTYHNIAAIGSVEGTFGGESVQGVVNTYQNILLTQNDQQARFSFMFTADGMKLYEPITLNGKTVDALTWNVDEKAFVSADGTTNLKLVVDEKGVLLKDLLGEYTFTCVGREGGTWKALSYDVVLAQNFWGTIVMTGLPFNVNFTYNTRKGALEVRSQQLLSSPNVWIATWASAVGNLTYSDQAGLYTLWNGDTENFVLTFVPNEYDWGYQGSGWAIWNVTARKVYSGYGVDLIYNMKMIKK